MGSTLSTTVGYGFTLPYLEDDADEDAEPKRVRELLEAHDEDSYEVLEVLLQDYPGFSFAFPSIYDYYDAPVVFLDSTTRNFYGAHAHEFQPDMILRHADDRVRELSKELGGSEPGWFIVTSYG